MPIRITQGFAALLAVALSLFMSFVPSTAFSLDDTTYSTYGGTLAVLNPSLDDIKEAPAPTPKKPNLASPNSGDHLVTNPLHNKQPLEVAMRPMKKPI